MLTLRNNLRRQTLVLAIAGAFGIAGAAQAATPGANLATVIHATQLSRGDVMHGALPMSHPIHVQIGLKLRNPDQLKAYDLKPHQPMSQAQLAANHLPTQAQAQAVANFLKQSGFTNVKISRNRMLVSGDGNAAVASRAFQTSFAQVRTHDGRETFANTTAVKLPANLQAMVNSVQGLQKVHKAHIYAMRANATGGIGGHNPLEFADIYGASGLNPASNVDVAVFGWGAMNLTLDDLSQFESENSLTPTTTNVVCVDYGGYNSGVVNTSDPTCENYDEGTVEWDIDSQDIVAMSGGVQSLTFFAAYGGYNASITNALNEIVTPTAGEPLATVVNQSFGECERYEDSGQGGDGSAQSNDALYAIGVAQGQTFSASTGDSGSDECGFGPAYAANSASYPASSPWNVAVAGTTLNASGGVYSRETEWVGSGGSPSSFEISPDWQTALTYGTYAGFRGPDVAFDANPNSGAIVITYGENSQWGGTSLASPIFVGAWARLIANGDVDTSQAGPQLYAMPASDYHDITGGNNHGYITKRGWDWASGRGSLILSNFSAGGGE